MRLPALLSRTLAMRPISHDVHALRITHLDKPASDSTSVIEPGSKLKLLTHSCLRSLCGGQPLLAAALPIQTSGHSSEF